MDMFLLTLKQMLMMFAFIVVGVILRKKAIVPENSGTMLARLETYVFVPALSLYTMIARCTVETFAENSSLILYGFVIMLVAVLLSYPLSALFIRRASASSELTYRRNIYKYAMACGNYGFVGNYIILGIWGDEMFYKYSMFCLLLGVLCTAWGLYILIPKDKRASVWGSLKKGLLAPPMIAIFVGMAIGLLGLGKYVPDFVVSAFSDAGKCQAPVAMLLAGVIIGGCDLKKLLLNKKVYLATFLRLIVIPAAFMLVLRAIGASVEVMIFALVAFAAPLGLNTVVYPAAFGGETETGGSMAMISHAFSVITIPIMYLVFIGNL